MSTLTKEVRDLVIQSRDLMQKALELADPKTHEDFGGDSKEDQLRFYMFVNCMEDAVQGTREIARVCEMTDEDLREMCAKADVTLSTAIQNARMNLMFKVLDLNRRVNDRLSKEEA